MLTVGSLFAGIGGLDLGLERAGMQVRWQVENDPYCIRVLAKHWPDVKRYGDVKLIDWKEIEPIDLICGGFPCQPVSVAGARKGDKDERWLWPEFLRTICEVRPRYALVENVPGLLAIDCGRLAGRVSGDMAEARYDSEWRCLSAYQFGAPHLRYRIFIVAYPHESRRWKESFVFPQCEDTPFARYDGSKRFVEDTRCLVGEKGAEVQSFLLGFTEGWDSCSESSRSSEAWNVADSKSIDVSWSESKRNRRGESETSSGNSDWWAVEPDVGRVADGVPSRVDRLRCLGNAVVPQVAEYIGRLIVEADRCR